MSATHPVPGPMSLDEFLTWDPGDGRRWQLIDGRPQAMAPAAPVHGALQVEVARLLANHIERLGRSCIVIAEPGIAPTARAADNYRIPDLVVTCTQGDLAGPMVATPVLTIEILSPSNHAETWSNIWTYTGIPSLLEILVLHSSRVGGALLRRRADGTWPDAAEPLGETLVLESLAFSAPLAALYRTTALS